MKRILLMLILVTTSSMADAYNRTVLLQLLQDQAYTDVIALADATPIGEQDLYLFNTAGYAAYQSAMPEKAAQYFQYALAVESNNTTALLYTGLITKARSANDALPYFLKLIVLKPDNPRNYRLAADCYADLKMPDSTFALVTRAWKVAKPEAAIINSYADGLLERKKFAAADTILQQALVSYPKNGALLGTAVKAAYLEKRYKQVLSLTDELFLTGTIGYVPFFYGLLAAYQLKDYDRCVGIYQLLAAAGHETEQVLYYAAKSLAALKRYDESNKLLQQCVKSAISENAPAYYTELGENQVAMKRYGGAQRYYDTARYLSGDAMLLYRKALAYDAANQPQQAQAAYHSFLLQPGAKDSALVRYVRSRISGSGIGAIQRR